MDDKIQKVISNVWASLYKKSFSKLLISPFIRRYSLQSEVNRFVPASGKKNYLSYQDFFTRKLAQPFEAIYTSIFPCEGMICESGQLDQLPSIKVKGQKFKTRNIFGELGEKIPSTHFFINIFLHNHNYHRFHAPVSGVVKSLKRIPGQLNFLRPWLYSRSKVSSPSCVNERIVMEIENSTGQSWFLSFVGGMGVGAIKIHDKFQIGSQVLCGEEIGLFLLGSTCCIAAPTEVKKYKYLAKGAVGDPL